MTIEHSETNSVEVKYYKVTTNYTSKYYDHRRLLFLSSFDPKLRNSGGVVKNVFIYFYLPEHFTIKDNAHVIGHFPHQNQEKMELSLPVPEFEDMYKILQTEKPVYFYWRTEKNKPWVTLFGLSSTESELPGEGLTDSSWFGLVPPPPPSEELLDAKPKDLNS